MESVSCRFIVHASEPFEVFGVLGMCAVPVPQSFFDFFQFDLLLIRFRSLWINLHHVLPQFLLFSLLILLFELVVELGLNFRNSSVFDFLSK